MYESLCVMTTNRGTVFLSYKSEDRQIVAHLVRALEENNFDVWWDQDIQAGDRWDQRIAQQLQQAECVVVVWSENSVQSRWVRDEAQFGAERQILVPISIDGTGPPLGFRSFQSTPLTSADGSFQEARLAQIIDGIKTKIGRSGIPPSRPPKPVKFSKTTAFWIALTYWIIAFWLPVGLLAWVHGPAVWEIATTNNANAALHSTIIDNIWLLFFTHENFFWYSMAFLPNSVYFLARGIRTALEEQLNQTGIIVAIVVCLILTTLLSYADLRLGKRNITEYAPEAYSKVHSSGSEVGRQKRVAIEIECTSVGNKVTRVTVYEHLKSRKPECREAFEKYHHGLADAQLHATASVAYFIGIFMLYLFWVVYVCVLGVVTFGARPWTIPRVVPNVLMSGAISFTWFVLYVPYLVTKKEIYLNDPLGSGIFLGFLIVGLFYYSWTVLADRYLSGKHDAHRINVIFWLCAFLTVALIAEHYKILKETNFLRPDMPKPAIVLLVIFVLLYFMTSFFRQSLTRASADAETKN